MSKINPYYEPAFVGRMDSAGGSGELSFLLAQLEAARDHGQGVPLQVRGNAGVGKSRLLQEFGRRALQNRCGVIYMSMTELLGDDPLREFVGMFAAGVEALSPRQGNRQRQPRADLPGPVRWLAKWVGNLGIAAGVSSAGAGEPLGLMLLPVGLGLKMAAELTRASEGSAGASEDVLSSLRSLWVQVGRDLSAAKTPTALAVIVDQWDDILRLRVDDQARVKNAVEALIRDWPKQEGSSHLLLVLGVRNEQASLCLSPRWGHQLLVKDVTPLRLEEASRIVLAPRGRGSEGPQYFTESAAAALTDRFFGAELGAYPGDLACLLAIVGSALMACRRQGIELPADQGTELDEVVAHSLQELADLHHDGFLGTFRDQDGSQEFLECLAESVRWESISLPELQLALTERTGRPVGHSSVHKWLEWWITESIFMAGGDRPETYRFRHETYLKALQKSVEGEDSEALDRARVMAHAALKLMMAPSSGWREWAQAARNLAQIPRGLWSRLGPIGARVEAAFGDAAQARDSYYREGVAEALGQTDQIWAKDPLVMLLLDRNESVAAAAANALGMIRSKDAIQPLIDALDSGRPAVQERASWALGWIGAQEAAGALGQLLRSDVGPEPALQAVKALTHLGGAAAIQALRGAIDHQPPKVQAQATAALARLESLAKEELWISELYNDDILVLQTAIRSLAQIRSLRAVEPLIELLRDSSVSPLKKLDS